MVTMLKSFAELEETPGVPGLDLPGLDIASVARGVGCHAVDLTSTGDLEKESGSRWNPAPPRSSW